MPLTTIHRSRCSLSRGDWTVMIWTEYGFEPAAAQDFVSPAGFRHWRGDAEPVVVKVPPGELRRDAETAHWLAERGLDGFRIATEDDMTKRRRDDGPVLFADLTDCGETAHRPDERPGPCGLPRSASDPEAFAASGDGIDRAERLEDAIRRALAQLHAALDGDEIARCATARAILEGALGGTRGRASA